MNLIGLKQEGDYWDYKKQWYKEGQEGDMLHDIICMANNLANRDAYIIIGVDEENDYNICGVLEDTRRRNTQQIVDFLCSKKFAGENRPLVTVETLDVGTVIDVIVIHNATNTPYFLKERYKKVNANNIYVRVQDTNTPITDSADMQHIEYLWKKRFGMLLTPIDRVKLYLKDRGNWEESPAYESKQYYKFAPEYTIEHTYEADDRRDGYEYYLFDQTDIRPHWCEIRVKYHQTVLADLGGVILDGGRYFSSVPLTGVISFNEYGSWYILYKYMIKEDLEYIVHDYYYQRKGEEEQYAYRKFIKNILFFDNKKEHKQFMCYVQRFWAEQKELNMEISMPYFPEIEGYNMDAIMEQYKNVQILQKMLLDFRKINKKED